MVEVLDAQFRWLGKMKMQLYDEPKTQAMNIRWLNIIVNNLKYSIYSYQFPVAPAPPPPTLDD